MGSYMTASYISRSSDGCLCRRGERELEAGPAPITRRHTDFPCESLSRHACFRARAFSGVLLHCRGVATPSILPEFLGSMSWEQPRAIPNQAMQRTASRSTF